MTSIVRAALLVAGLFTTACALESPAVAATPSTLAAIAANDNTAAGGRLAKGVLHLAIVARNGMWYPDGRGTAGLPIEAFGEDGKALQIPGPLVRVPVGTRVVATVRNDLGHDLDVRGLANPAAAGTTVMHVVPGATRTVSFVLDRPGAYGYYGSDYRTGNGKSPSETIDSRLFRDAQLSGAIIVDPQRGPRDDHVFVLGTYAPVKLRSGSPNFLYMLFVINGRSFPATEHLTYARGQHVRWAVYDASSSIHPMHLHGFYFRRDVPDAFDEVTHAYRPGEASELTWTADRSGDWMFHCHIMDHTSRHPSIATTLAYRPHKGDISPITIAARFHQPGVPMSGMAIAVHVRPRPGDASPVAAARARRLTLAIDSQQPTDAPYPGLMRETLHLSDGAHTTDSTGNLGPAIVLTRGEPVAIAIINHMNEPTSMHWHGITLADSYYDGGAGMAMNMPVGHARMSPPIAPGATFVARFAPPNAGTFMYHAHMDDGWQMAGGVSGPLIVTEPGHALDPRTDHVVMISEPYDENGSSFAIAGSLAPAPMTMTAGISQRLRLVMLTVGGWNFAVSLVDGTRVIAWTPLAKDGRDLPAHLQRQLTATTAMTIGETRDFGFTPAHAGRLALNVYDLDNNGMLVATQPIDVVAP